MKVPHETQSNCAPRWFITSQGVGFQVCSGSHVD
jgi:hypothetical protein